MTARERKLVSAVAAAGLAGCLAWGGVRLVAARDAATSAARALADCQRLARRIEAARGPAGSSDAEVARTIESAAKAAELPDESVERIEPGSPKRLGDTPFVEQPTTVELRDVELRQLFRFLHALAAAEGPGAPGVGLKDIRLTAPASPTADRDVWSVQGTVTHRMYAPVETKTVR